MKAKALKNIKTGEFIHFENDFVYTLKCPDLRPETATKFLIKKFYVDVVSHYEKTYIDIINTLDSEDVELIELEIIEIGVGSNTETVISDDIRIKDLIIFNN
jgi:hypothetical protein